MIKVSNLHKSFGSQEVLKGVDAVIKKGEKIAILGPSGCGKSTFLRCLNMLEKPTSGSILLSGIEVTGKGANVNKVRQKLGMVFQNFNLFPHLTILKNITLAPTVLKLKTHAQAKEEAYELLKRIGLESRANSYPSQLSGGQKQRVAIIRALAMEPEVMLFDEPTSALDPNMVAEVLGLIKELVQSGMTMVIVTHEINFAKEIASKILFMDEGIIIEKAPPAEFFSNPQTEQAKIFLGIGKKS